MTEETSCPRCSTPLETEERPYTLGGFSLGRFEFLVCPVCKRVYHPLETSQAIEEAAKEKGIWGLEQEEEVLVRQQTTNEMPSGRSRGPGSTERSYDSESTVHVGEHGDTVTRGTPTDLVEANDGSEERSTAQA
jgi:uncharacterized protein YbaR (Trm112 family)